MITPEASPKAERLPNQVLKETDLAISMTEEPVSQAPANRQEISVPRLPPRSGLSSANLATLTQTGERDTAVMDAWMSLRDEAMQDSSFANVRGCDEEKREHFCSVARQPTEDGMGLSGHSLPLSESNFALFESDLLKEEDDAGKEERCGASMMVEGQAENYDGRSRNDDEPIDLEPCKLTEAVDSQAAADFAPMATEEYADLRIESEQTEEMLVMLTDPFDTDFF